MRKSKRSTENPRTEHKRWINPDHLDSSENSKYSDATPLLREQGKTPKS